MTFEEWIVRVKNHYSDEEIREWQAPMWSVQLASAWQAATKTERERCARIVETYDSEHLGHVCEHIIALIRRGDA